MTLLSRLFSRLFPALPEELERDLIDHPDFQGMSLRDLADLPFPRPASRDWDEDAVEAAATQPQELDAIRPAA